MALLTDTDLKAIICSENVRLDKQKKLHIFPYDEKSMTPVGYDLRVGSPFSLTSHPGLQELKSGEKMKLKPGDTALVTTVENVSMPENRTVSALICSKVSKVSKGLSHVSTTIDPDWGGNLLIAIHNTAKNIIELQYGERFCTVVFFENKTPSTKDCERQPGRLDIFMKQWVATTKRANRLTLLKKAVPPFVVLASFPIGYHFFGNAPGLAATIAGGVALSQIIKSYLE